MATGGAMNQQQGPMPAQPPGVQKPPAQFPTPQNPSQYVAGGQPKPAPNVFDTSANALNKGVQTATSAANYQPMMVTPQSVATTSLTPYMNPYQQDVIDASMAQMADAQAQTMNTLDAQAGAAGAYGGSRHGVAMAESNDAYAQQQAAMLAQLNSQNYTQAQQAAMYDTGLNMQGQVANQNAGLAGAGLNLTAAGQLGSLSNLGFTQGMDITNQQANQGLQIQAMNQALIDATKGQYAGFTGAPGQAAGLLAGTAGSVPYPTSQTQTQQYQPGVFDYLSLAAGL